MDVPIIRYITVKYHYGLLNFRKYSWNQKSEHDIPTFDFPCYFNTGATRFFFFTISLPGMLVLRASCFTRRLCLAIPFDGRLALVLTVVVSNCITPCFVKL
jgi:hypothetical protein